LAVFFSSVRTLSTSLEAIFLTGFELGASRVREPAAFFPRPSAEPPPSPKGPGWVAAILRFLFTTNFVYKVSGKKNKRGGVPQWASATAIPSKSLPNRCFETMGSRIVWQRFLILREYKKVIRRMVTTRRMVKVSERISN